MSTTPTTAAGRGPRRLLLLAGCGLLGPLLALGLVSPLTPAHAAADETARSDQPAGALDFVEPTARGVRALVSVPRGADVDLDGVEVTIAGQDAEAQAERAGRQTMVRRATVLVIDTSNSMRGERFRAAKRAARTYLDTLPPDVELGVVSFADEARPVLRPTLDRDLARDVIDALELSRGTALYDGVIAGVDLLGDEGQRSLLVLSDGADTGSTPIESVLGATSEAGVLVDVVGIEQDAAERLVLDRIASAGDGELLEATSADLTDTFSARADVLATQILVKAELPAGVTSEQSEIEITLPSADGGEAVTASAFTTVRAAGAPPVAVPATAGWSPPSWAMYAGIVGIGLGLIVLMVAAVPRRARAASIADRVEAYARAATPDPTAQDDATSAAASAREAVEGVLARNRSLNERITTRLEGAGSSLKAAEWVMVHAGIFVGAGVVGLLFGGGNLAVGAIFLALGAVGPWLYLGVRRSRRRKAFNAALPDTMQLVSGSLSAGLSLAQSIDTIVREGTEPVASEFRRVLVETRLGVPIEEALEGVAQRFDSKDFEWVVMAIRIQRQVGGNLAELLDTVGATMREREYLRRQVNALAAEGKLSAIVLAVLPPGFLMYLLVAQRDYVMPMFTDPRGLMMMIGAGLWLGVGVFWMSKLVKVEV